ncbi:hypothetical protein EDB85DRAFT_2233205 [Lactarius pseudohatsudake]|nr:hypothetical protein EDB85DRAFT_2233205 [Lactarius pseudohatsudake]
MTHNNSSPPPSLTAGALIRVASNGVLLMAQSGDGRYGRYDEDGVMRDKATRGTGTRGLRTRGWGASCEGVVDGGPWRREEGKRGEGERERPISGPAPVGSLHLPGVEILTVPGQASSSDFVESFGGKNGEKVGVNEGWDGGVVLSDKGAAWGWAEGKEGKDGGTEAVAARPKKTREMRRKRKQSTRWSSRGSRYGAWRNDDSSTKRGHEAGHEEGYKEGRSASDKWEGSKERGGAWSVDVKGAGIGSQGSGEDGMGGGVLVMSSFTEGVRVERETTAELLSCAWRTREGAVIEHAMVKAPCVLEFRPRKSSVKDEAWGARRVLLKLEPIRGSVARLGGVTLTGGEAFTLASKLVCVCGKGFDEIRNCDSRNGEAEREVDGSESGAGKRGESVGMDMWRTGCVEVAGRELSRGVETRKAIGGEMSSSGGTSREGDIGPNIVTSSGLGEGGVMRPFGESLSRPGGVTMVDDWWGETGMLSENLSGGGSWGTISLDDGGGRSGELGRSRRTVTIGAGVDSSSRSSSTRDGDSDAGDKSLDAWETDSKPGVEIDGEVSRVKGKASGARKGSGGGESAFGDEASFGDGISNDDGVESDGLGEEGVRAVRDADRGAGAGGTNKSSETPRMRMGWLRLRNDRGRRGKKSDVRRRDLGLDLGDVSSARGRKREGRWQGKGDRNDRGGEGGLSKTTDETEDAAGMNVSSESSSVAEGANEYEEGIGWGNEDGGVNMGSSSFWGWTSVAGCGCSESYRDMLLARDEMGSAGRGKVEWNGGERENTGCKDETGVMARVRRLEVEGIGRRRAKGRDRKAREARYRRQQEGEGESLSRSEGEGDKTRRGSKVSGLDDMKGDQRAAARTIRVAMARAILLNLDEGRRQAILLAAARLGFWGGDGWASGGDG